MSWNAACTLTHPELFTSHSACSTLTSIPCFFAHAMRHSVEHKCLSSYPPYISVPCLSVTHSRGNTYCASCSFLHSSHLITSILIALAPIPNFSGIIPNFFQNFLLQLDKGRHHRIATRREIRSLPAKRHWRSLYRIGKDCYARKRIAPIVIEIDIEWSWISNPVDAWIDLMTAMWTHHVWNSL